MNTEEQEQYRLACEARHTLAFYPGQLLNRYLERIKQKRGRANYQALLEAIRAEKQRFYDHCDQQSVKPTYQNYQRYQQGEPLPLPQKALPRPRDWWSDLPHLAPEQNPC